MYSQVPILIHERTPQCAIIICRLTKKLLKLFQLVHRNSTYKIPTTELVLIYDTELMQHHTRE